MKIIKSAFASLLFLFANFASLAADAPIKIAIIGDTGKFRPQMDLLSAELLKKPGLAILDRADTDKILEEHSILLSDVSKSSIRIGKLLGADGVILLKEFEAEGKKYSSARLVAVKPGVIVDACVIPTDVKSEVYDINKAVMVRLVPLFEKLKISREDAIPVSLLNFRAISPDPMLIRVEKELNPVLAHRLMMEKKVFVNERWNMGHVEFEKDLDDDDSSFWTGSYIVEGNISGNNDSLKASITIRNKDGVKQESTVDGKASDLAEFNGRVVDKTLSEIKAGGHLLEWDREKEAKEYYDEGIWALNNGLYDFAQSALDSAWAMGCKSTECSNARLKTLTGKLYHMARFPAEEKWITTRYLNGIPIIIIPVEDYLDTLIYTLDVFNDTASKNSHDPDSILKTGVGLLLFSSVILHSAYQNKPHNDVQLNAKLKKIRCLTRECFKISMLLKSDPFKEASVYLFAVYFNYAPFWYENTYESLTDFRKVINGTFPGTEVSAKCGTKFRLALMYNYNYDIPKGIDWLNPQDGRVADNSWKEFTLSLLKSSDDIEILTGIFLSTKNRNNLSDVIKEYILAHKEKVIREYENPMISPYVVIIEMVRDPEVKMTLLHDMLDYYFAKYKSDQSQELFWHFFNSNHFSQSSTKIDISKKIMVDIKMKEIYKLLENMRYEHMDLFRKNPDLEKLYQAFRTSNKISSVQEDIYPIVEPDNFITQKDILGEKWKPYMTHLGLPMQLSGDKIWYICTDTGRTKPEYFIAEVDIQNFDLVKYHIPSEIDGKALPGIKYESFGTLFTIDKKGNLFAIVLSDNSILCFNKNKNWSRINNNFQGNIQSIQYYDSTHLLIGYSPKKLLNEQDSTIGYDAGAIMYNTADNSTSILFSTRRKPPISSLDAKGSIMVNSIFTKNNNVFVNYTDQTKQDRPNKYKTYISFLGDSNRCTDAIDISEIDSQYDLINDNSYFIKRADGVINIYDFDEKGIKIPPVFKIDQSIDYTRSLCCDSQYIFFTPHQNPGEITNISTVLNIIEKDGRHSKVRLKYDIYEDTSIYNEIIGQSDKKLILADSGGYHYIAVVSKEKVIGAIRNND